MPATKATATKATATTKKVTAPVAKTTGPVLTEVAEDAFPKVTRVSETSSQWIEPAAAMVNDHKAFKLAVADRDEANKVTNNIRQIMRRVHNRSLAAVFLPNEKALYVKDGGPIKERSTAGNGKK